MVHRVRTIIRYLEYGPLRSALPKKAMFTGIKRGGNMPRLARRIGYAQFGMFLDWFIRKVLAINHRIKLSKKFDADVPAYDLYVWTVQHYFGDIPVSKHVFDLDKQYYRNIAKFVQENFGRAKNVKMEPEWTYENISGHPDLVIDGTIYDIKTTGQFNSMRTQTIFQLLAYYCLAQLLELPITAIGVVLPAQNKVMRVDMNGWNWVPFWEAMNGALQIKLRLLPSMENLLLFQTSVQPSIGYHVSKENTIYATLKGLTRFQPWQIYFAGRCQAEFKISERDIVRTKTLTEQGYRLYVHSPHTLNLSRHYQDNWVVKCVVNHLSVAVRMGCKGVVVHCGVKAKGVDYNVAYENMYQSVVEIAVSASPDCPLLIETSAGETGSLLSDSKDLIAFYHALPKETRLHTAICVDTCHVWAAGHIPQEFINQLVKADIPIRLIHFNDSKGDRGCCKDRHAPICTGYIGLENLNMVGTWALENKIDMVYE